jgi:hypothetical protein
MSFNWKALVNLARDLEHQAASVDDPEAHFRSAVSRAYFGAFGHACNYAKEFLDFQSRELVEDHGRLRAHLKRKKKKRRRRSIGTASPVAERGRLCE